MGPSHSDPQVAGSGVQNNMIAVYRNGYVGPFSNVGPFAIQWPNGVYQNAQGSASFNAGNTPQLNQTSSQPNVVFDTSPHNNALGIQSYAHGTAQTAPRYIGPGHMNQPHGSIAEMNQNLQPGMQHYVNTAARMTLNTAREALASRGVHVPMAGLVPRAAPVGAAAFFPQSGGPSSPAGPSGHARPTIVSSSSVAPAHVAQNPISTNKDTLQEKMPVWDIVGTQVLPALPTSSGHLRAMTDTPLRLPSLAAVMFEDNFPFMPSYGLSTATCWPVVRILNIPYTTTRGEILAMLGRNARLPKDVEEPVHIIMDKTTSKTQDAFVEFATHESAVKAVERHEDLILKHRQPRLGQRPIEMEISSQNALCKALFPFAQGVNWKGSMPMIQPADSTDPNAPWTRFRGFMTGEEMALLVRFVEVPHRVSFTSPHLAKR
jgi:RNA recognition motif-containing protein